MKSEKNTDFLYRDKTLHEWLVEAVRRIVDGFDPLRVILSGSLTQ